MNPDQSEKDFSSFSSNKLRPQDLGFAADGSSLIKEIKGTPITFTPLEDLSQLTEAVQLQQEVWSLSDYDICPPHMWVTAFDTGGHVLGARNENGELVAFVTGFGGYDHLKRAPFIMSDMAGVKENLRDSNIGFSLKLAQALHVMKQGISEIRWTFDPLRSRNAHLNIHKLGGVATDFYVDKYGDALTGSQNFEITDRFLVKWNITDPKTQARLVKSSPPPSMYGVTTVEMGVVSTDDVIAIEIPTNLASLTEEEIIAHKLRFRALASLYVTTMKYQCFEYVTTENFERGYYLLKNM